MTHTLLLQKEIIAVVTWTHANPQKYTRRSMEGPDLSEGDMTHSESVYACNFAICTNEYRLQCPDTKVLRNTTEHNDRMLAMKLP